MRRLLRAPVILLSLGLGLGAYSLTFTHVAGSLGGPGADDGLGAAARFKGDSGIAVDASGNIYVSDSDNHTIRKITPSGDVTTLAGLAEQQGLTFTTRGARARFRIPEGIAVDGSGNVYVADTGNHMIKKITPIGRASVYAGTGTSGNTNGPVSTATLNSPTALAFDGSGNLYVTEGGGSNDIRMITPGGTVSTFATGFSFPTGIVFHEGTSALYVADFLNHVIRQVTVPGGVVSTFAGTVGAPGHVNDIGAAARFYNPSGICVDGSGTFYISDSGDHTIRTMNTGANVGTLAGLANYPGPDDGTGGNARFRSPGAIAVDGSGNVYVADTSNNTVRKIVSGGVVTTLAGLATASGFNNATGPAATFSNIAGLAYYPGPVGAGALIFVADSDNNAIRQVTYDGGAVTTLAGGTLGSTEGTGTGAMFNHPLGVYFEPGTDTVLVADTGNNTIRQVTLGGTTSLFAGSPGVSGNANGDRLTTAKFTGPTALVGDPSSGDIYVADSANFLVRKITRTTGTVSTLAGGGPCCDVNANGTNASFSAPLSSIAIDALKNVYVTESQNGVIRKITPSGDVTTLAGSCCPSIPADGNGSLAAFGYPGPRAIALDPAGSTGFVADGIGQAVRSIATGGNVGTVGGKFNTSGTADGTGSVARFNVPNAAVMFGSSGVFIGENNAIRVGRPSIADLATIDSTTGMIGTARQLDTNPQTATSWQWSIIRRPSGSSATFSSPTVRNPTFTPDVPDLYVFKLIAKSSAGSSITTVSLQANGAATSLFIAYPAPVAGVPFSTPITATDADGIIADGYTGTLHFTSTDPMATVPPDYTFQLTDHGTHTVSGWVLRTAGPQQLKATDSVNSLTGIAALFVSPASTSTLTLSLPASVRAGAPADATITSRDPYNNITTQYTGTIHFTSSDASSTLPADYTFVSADHGVHTFTGGVVLRSLGTMSVTATDTLHSGINGSASVVVTAFGSSSDLNGDDYSDILLQNSSGAVAAWLMNGATVTTGTIVGNPGPTWVARASADLNGDGRADIVYQNSATGDVAVWFMNGPAIIGAAVVGTPGTSWTVVGTGDFNGDGKSDIVFQNQSTGAIAIWEMNGATIIGGAVVGTPGTGWAVKAIADFNADRRSDILLQNASSSAIAEWQMNGLTITAGAIIGAPAMWSVQTAGDSDGDAKADIFLQNTSTGDVAEWKMAGTSIIGGAIIGSPGTGWSVIGTGDYNRDGKADLILRTPAGDIAQWQLNGFAITSGGVIASPGSAWTPIMR